MFLFSCCPVTSLPTSKASNESEVPFSISGNKIQCVPFSERKDSHWSQVGNILVLCFSWVYFVKWGWGLSTEILCIHLPVAITVATLLSGQLKKGLKSWNCQCSTLFLGRTLSQNHLTNVSITERQMKYKMELHSLSAAQLLFPATCCQVCPTTVFRNTLVCKLLKHSLCLNTCGFFRSRK